MLLLFLNMNEWTNDQANERKLYPVYIQERSFQSNQIKYNLVNNIYFSSSIEETSEDEKYFWCGAYKLNNINK